VRYFFDQDNDAHWYLVEEDCRLEWEDWLGLDAEDHRSWSHPACARSLGGGVSQWTFTDPKLEGNG
jgi:hypothetical protein